MPLAVRIIPTVLIRGQQLVKGRQFNSWRTIGHAQQAARIYAARQCDEICLLDISATPEGRGPNLDMIRVWTDANFAPIAVGGGIRSINDVKEVLRAGADKVVIGTNWKIIPECVSEFGSQAIVVSIDYLDTFLVFEDVREKYPSVATHCGDHITGENAISLAREIEHRGTGEILLTSIDREGTMTGYDLDLIHEVSKSVSIPVIAHGGAGTYEHMYEAIKAGASAVAAGAMFCFTDQTPRGAAEYLSNKGVEVRL